MRAIEQISYLWFIKRLDELELNKEKRAKRLGGEIKKPLFSPAEQRCRWSYFRNLNAEEMLKAIRDEAFPLIKNMGQAGGTYAKHMKEALFFIQSPALLANVVGQINDISMSDRDRGFV